MAQQAGVVYVLWDILPPSSKVPFAAGELRFWILLGGVRFLGSLCFSDVVRELAISKSAGSLSGKLAAYPETVSISEEVWSSQFAYLCFCMRAISGGYSLECDGRG